MDLFAPVVPDAHQHVYFRELVSGRHDDKVKLLADWAREFTDRDGKFVDEFQRTFDSAFWELYLFAALRSIGAGVDVSHARPDFLVDLASTRFVAEATIASNAAGFAPAARPQFDHLPPLEARLEYQSIRLANGLSAKLHKYRSDYACLAHVSGQPFVVCIAPFEQQWSHFLADRALRRVLFAVDVPLAEIDSAGRRVIVGEAHAPHAWKPNGAQVPFGLFRNPSARELSGVLFNSTATFGKLTALAKSPNTLVTAVRYDAQGTEPQVYTGDIQGYSESLLDGLALFLNPHAETPLDPAAFVRAGIAVHTLSLDGTYETCTPDGFLFARSTVRLVDRDMGKPVSMNKADPEMKQPTIERFTRNGLNYVGGHVGLAADVHLAHHRSWTVLVARDLIDNDWGALCRPGLFRSVDAFRRANLADDAGEIVGFFPDPDAALAAASRMIDDNVQSECG